MGSSSEEGAEQPIKRRVTRGATRSEKSSNLSGARRGAILYIHFKPRLHLFSGSIINMVYLAPLSCRSEFFRNSYAQQLGRSEGGRWLCGLAEWVGARHGYDSFFLFELTQSQKVLSRLSS